MSNKTTLKRSAGFHLFTDSEAEADTVCLTLDAAEIVELETKAGRCLVTLQIPQALAKTLGLLEGTLLEGNKVASSAVVESKTHEPQLYYALTSQHDGVCLWWPKYGTAYTKDLDLAMLMTREEVDHLKQIVIITPFKKEEIDLIRGKIGSESMSIGVVYAFWLENLRQKPQNSGWSDYEV